MFLCDLSLTTDNIATASYADDGTPYTPRNSIEEVIEKLENASKTFLQWFSDKQMKGNPDKCRFLCSSDGEGSLSVEKNKTKKQ